jgi:TRAP-type C4-dicarboxylate transport system permease small subunit
MAALFFTFLLQIFSRYVLHSPLSWTLELCSILWVWIVFFGCAFLVRDKDQVSFDILYFSVSKKTQLIFSIISAIALIIIIAWSFLPTIDYIDWMKIRKTTTIKIPFIWKKIPLSYIFSIYGIFMISIIIAYIFKLISYFKNGLPNIDRIDKLDT